MITTAGEIRQVASLQAFLDSKQCITLWGLPESVTHLAANLFQSYVEYGITVVTGPLWLRTALDEYIWNRPHASECALDMVSFILGEIRRQVQDEFIILLSAKDAVILFRENLNLFHIAAVPQD